MIESSSVSEYQSLFCVRVRTAIVDTRSHCVCVCICTVCRRCLRRSFVCYIPFLSPVPFSTPHKEGRKEGRREGSNTRPAVWEEGLPPYIQEEGFHFWITCRMVSSWNFANGKNHLGLSDNFLGFFLASKSPGPSFMPLLAPSPRCVFAPLKSISHWKTGGRAELLRSFAHVCV